MKHTAFILAALAIAGLSASCQKSEPVIETGDTITFSASIEGKARPAGAKAVIDGDTPKWEAGDAVRLYCFSTGIDDATYAAGKTSPAFKTSASLTSGGAASATFTFSVTGTMGQADCFLATIGEIPTSVYWAKKDGSQGPKVRVAHLGYDKTSLQNKGTYNTRAACAVGKTLAFKNVWHLIRYTPTVTGAAYAVLSSIDGTTPVTNQVADIFFDSATGNVTSVVHAGLDRTAVYAQVTSGEENYFSLAPGMTITGGFKIEIMDDGDNVLQTFTYAHDFTTVRNRITTISNFDDRVEESTKAVLADGSTFNAAVKDLAGGSSSTIWSNDTNIQSIVIDTRSAVSTGTEVQGAASDVAIYANYSGNVLTLSTSANKIYLPANAANTFCYLNGLTTITGSDKLVMDNVTNASDMFNGCIALAAYGDLNLPQALNTQYMFDGCIALTSLGSVNIPLSVNTNSMFSNCRTLATLGAVQMDAVVNASYMFSDCRVITSLTLNGADNNTLTTMNYMFNNCKELTGFAAFSPVTASATNTSYMFYGCEKLESVDISGIAGSLTSVDNMFNTCRAIDGISFNSGFNTAAVTSMASMFSACSSLTSLDLSMFNTSSVTSFYGMFSGCSKLTTIGATTHFTTSGLTAAGSMFNGCRLLESVDMTGVEGNLQTIGSMFSGCQALTTIHLSNNFNTAAVSSYASVFDYCTSLSQLYIKGFHLTKGNVGTNASQLASRLMNALRGVPTSCTIHYTSNNYSTEYSVPNYLPYTTTSGSGNGGYNWTTAN